MTLREQDRAMQATANEVAARVQAHVDENLAAGGACDFCCELLDPATVATWVTEPLLATTTVIDEDTGGAASIQHAMSDAWAACPACDSVVAARDPARLADHVIANPGSRAVSHPAELSPFIHTELVDLYGKFYEGRPQRVAGPER